MRETFFSLFYLKSLSITRLTTIYTSKTQFIAMLAIHFKTIRESNLELIKNPNGERLRALLADGISFFEILRLRIRSAQNNLKG